MVHGRWKNESEDYRRARADLLEAEIELMKQRERVAELRRSLPADTEVGSYVFQEAEFRHGGDVRYVETSLAGLFEDRAKSLVVYQFMLGGAQKEPCPMCTMWTDGFNGIAKHLRQRVNFAIVAQAEIRELADLGLRRDWKNLRLVSCAGSTFKTDWNFADHEERQYPGISVFTRSNDGSVNHFYSACAIMKEGVFRGLDLLAPVWSFLDLTPEGRGDWMPAVKY